VKPGILAEPALIGREHELERLQVFLNSAIEGKGKIVFISGPAGTGKTRLVNEFVNNAKQKREITVLSGWCLSNAANPYFPFIEAFNAYYSTRSDTKDGSSAYEQPKIQLGSEGAEQSKDRESEIKAWLIGSKYVKETRKKDTLTPEAWKDLTFAAIGKALLSFSAKRPLILFIDDLQWADSASLSLLHYIGRMVGSSMILFLATFRSEELNPDAEGRPHPLVEVLRLMRRENLFEEIKLPDLSQTNVFTLAENMMGGHLDSELADTLVRESQGNPCL
jgi:predicted ATPase